MEKHSAYFNLLEQLAKPGCPVCAQVQDSLKAFLDTYLYEGVTDNDNWNRLVESDGYCPRHCGMMEEFSDGLAVALFYTYLYKRRMAELGKPAPTGWFKKAPEFKSCPACDYEAELEQGQLRLLLQALDEPEFTAAFEKSDGLCLSHARQGCRLDSRNADKLVELTRKSLGGLVADLDEFVRKSDHRNNEKMGPEGDSWRRALRAFHGIRYEGDGHG